MHTQPKESLGQGWHQTVTTVTKPSTPQLLLHIVTITTFLETIKDIKKKEGFVNIMPSDLFGVKRGLNFLTK